MWEALNVLEPVSVRDEETAGTAHDDSGEESLAT